VIGSNRAWRARELTAADSTINRHQLIAERAQLVHPPPFAESSLGATGEAAAAFEFKK
jgi:hypothetical protein